MIVTFHSPLLKLILSGLWLVLHAPFLRLMVNSRGEEWCVIFISSQWLTS